MNLYKSFVIAAASSLFLAAVAQDNIAPKVTVKLAATAKPGAVIRGTVTMTFAEGLHGYQNPPSNPDLIPVKVAVTTKGVTLKSAKYPAGKDESVGGDPTMVKVYEGTIEIPVTVVVPKKKGKVLIKFDASYQQCNSQSCYPPSDVVVSAPVTVK